MGVTGTCFTIAFASLAPGWYRKLRHHVTINWIHFTYHPHLLSNYLRQRQPSPRQPLLRLHRF